MTESLQKSLHDAEFLRADLLGALAHSSAIEAIILMPLVERAAMLQADIAAFISARGQS